VKLKALAVPLLAAPTLVLALIIGLGGAGQTAAALAGCGTATGTGATLAKSAARAAGFPEAQLDTAAAVAGAESGWNPTATNLNANGTTDYGMWQINSVHAAALATGNWRDPTDNARMALAVWRQAGGSWAPWVTYNTGAYLAHLPAASAAQTGAPAACGAAVVAGTPGNPAVGTGEGGLRPQTVAARRAVLAAFGPMTIYGLAGRARVSDHPRGLALDFMTDADRAKGSRIAAWVVAHATQLRVKYVIYSRHIWSVERAAEGWRLMEDRGSPNENHENHVHVSLVD
jgi:hypothetical protein